MAIGLDTSIVVRLLTGEPAAHARAAWAVIDAAEAEITVSDLVVGESYFVLIHHYDASHDDAIAALRNFIVGGRVRPDGAAGDVLARMPDGASGPGLMDRLIHADYARAGDVLLTFDRAAARLPGARLLTA